MYLLLIRTVTLKINKIGEGQINKALKKNKKSERNYTGSLDITNGTCVSYYF